MSEEEAWDIPEAELHPSLLVRVVLWTCGSIALLYFALR
jgi:hypothetical protein